VRTGAGSARRPSVLPMTILEKRFARRHRFAVAAITLALSAVAAVTGGAAWAGGTGGFQVADPQDGQQWAVIAVQGLDSATDAAYLDGACASKFGGGFAARLWSSGWDGWACGPRGSDGSVTPWSGYGLTRSDLAWSCKAKYPGGPSSAVQPSSGQVLAWMPVPVDVFSSGSGDHTTDCVILQRPGSPGSEKMLMPPQEWLR
jgi:hypothetical protein